MDYPISQRQRHRTENNLNIPSSNLNISPTNLHPSLNNSPKTTIGVGNFLKNNLPTNHSHLSINTVIELQNPNRLSGIFYFNLNYILSS